MWRPPVITEFDPKLVAVIWDMLKSVGSALFVAAAFFVKLGRDRTKSNAALSEKISESLGEFEGKVENRLHKEDVRIAALERRLDEGAQWMSRIEERLLHMPNKDELHKIEMGLGKLLGADMARMLNEKTIKAGK